MGIFDRWRSPRRRPSKEESEPLEENIPALEIISAALLNGRLAEARGILDSALRQHPKNAPLLLLSAQQHRQSGDIDQAFADCDAALNHSTRPALVHLEMAECHLARPDLSAALDTLQVAVTLDEDLGVAWLHLGELLSRFGRYEEAIDALQRATLSCEGNTLSRAWRILANNHSAVGDIKSAAQDYMACLALTPDDVNALVGLGDARLLMDDELGALECYDRIQILLPSRDVPLLLNEAIAHQQLGQRDIARKILEQALFLKPNDFTVRWNLSQLDLLECNWRQGWKNYSARFVFSPDHYRPLPYKKWLGQRIENQTLLITASEGLGDEILYASCFSDAIAYARHCIIDCDTKLVPLFARSFPTSSVISSDRNNSINWLDGLPEPNWQIAAGDLPALFRNDDSDFPRHQGYIFADDGRRAYWKKRLSDDLGAGLKVGISWRGGTIKTRTVSRSLGAQKIKPILDVPNVQFVNLQYGDYKDELAEINEELGKAIHDYPDAVTNYDETAALVSSLDLVITVCTAIVHLTGALGKPVWILCPHSPSWRYTANRNSMPWYPSSRIFRQPVNREWAPTCQELADALTAMTKFVTD